MGNGVTLSTKLSLDIAYEAAILLLAIDLREIKIPVRNLNWLVYNVNSDFFIITKNWQQSKCPSSGERMQIVVYLYMENYAAIKKKMN